MKTRLLTTSAIAGLALLVLNPAYANGGAGGTGLSGAGGTAGATSTTGAGSNGGNSGAASTNTVGGGGGGGGGAGATGGNGGLGSDATATAGTGGATAGANGGSGQNGSTRGSSGGGGGAHGYVGATLPVATATGGTGGQGGSSTGGGGGGGAGGYGAVFTGSSVTGNIANNLTGGAGGNGGNGGGIAGNFAGRGGAGGIGLSLTGTLNNITISSTITGGKGGNAGSSVSAVTGTDGGVGLALGSSNTVTLTGSVTGGNGGTSTSGGAVGAGAAAITGSGIGLTIGSTGVVTAGLSGSSVRANAIHFTGGSNTLALATGAAITGNIVGAGADALTLNGTTTGSFDISTLSGFSTLAKSGAGTWTLTGTATYAGATTVTAGLLAVNGTTASSSGTTVSGTGTLGGTGTVRDVVLNSGATLAPGNSIGTMNVTGTLAFNSGSSYDVEFSPTASDHTIATGAITIDSGATLNLLGGAGTYDPSRTYTILTGSAVTGTFGTVTNDLAFLDETMIYNAGSVQVRMDRNDIDFTEVVSSDYAGAANVISDLGTGNELFDEILTLTDTQAASAIQQLSGEQNAAINNTVSTMTMQSLNHVADRINNISAFAGAGSRGFDVGNAALDDGTYTAAYLEPASGGHATGKGEIWGQAIGGLGRMADNGATPGQKSRNVGFMAGLDQPVGDHAYLGAYAGYVRNHTDTDDNRGNADINSYQLGVYAAQALMNGFILSGGAGASYNDIESVRHVTVGVLDFSPRGDTSGETVSAYAELGKSFVYADMMLMPFINLGITRSRTAGFTETDGGPANLTVDDKTTTNPISTLGARIGREFVANGTTFNVTGKLGWQHTYGDVDPTTGMQFASGSATFQSGGLPIARDAAVIGINVDTQISDGVTGYAGYDATLSADSSQHGFTLGAKMKF